MAPHDFQGKVHVLSTQGGLWHSFCLSAPLFPQGVLHSSRAGVLTGTQAVRLGHTSGLHDILPIPCLIVSWLAFYFYQYWGLNVGSCVHEISPLLLIHSPQPSCHFFFWDRISLRCPDCPGTFNPPALAFLVVRNSCFPNNLCSEFLMILSPHPGPPESPRLFVSQGSWVNLHQFPHCWASARLHGGLGEGLQRMPGKQNEQKMVRGAGWLCGAHGRLYPLALGNKFDFSWCLPS